MNTQGNHVLHLRIVFGLIMFLHLNVEKTTHAELSLRRTVPTEKGLATNRPGGKTAAAKRPRQMVLVPTVFKTVTVSFPYLTDKINSVNYFKTT